MPAPSAPPVAYEPQALQAAFAQLAMEAQVLGEDHEAWAAWFWRWNELKAFLEGEGARRYYAEAKNSQDPEAEAALRFMRERIEPVQEAGEAALREALLQAPRREALAERLGGPQLLTRLALDQASFHPDNLSRHTQEAEEVARYQRLLASAQIPIGGRVVPMARANALLNAPEAEEREGAWRGLAAWAEAQRPALHGHYDRLLGLRQAMAERLGEATYTPIAYRKLGRSDYGPAEVAKLREAIAQHALPLMAKVRAWQAEGLGRSPRPWDLTFFPALALGPGSVPLHGQLERASALFRRLDPALAERFEQMMQGGLIDLESRPGKRPGAFAISFADERRVAIMCNATGVETDVTTLLHEMGHAFQGWASCEIPAVALRIPTLDAAELSSMGMEFLALPHVEAFFAPPQAERYRRLKLLNTLQRLCYIAVVDAFQHWAYDHPGHSHEEREAEWNRLFANFQPGLDLSGQERALGSRWMRQAHLFAVPFYYIDYAIAELGALQLWGLSKRDPAAALARFHALCRAGGTMPLQALFAHVGLRSPFEPALLGELMAEVEAALAL